MQTEIKAINRVTSDEINLEMDESKNALVAQGEAKYVETTRSGKHFIMRNTTAVAAVVALPTTAVNCAFYNTDPDGGRSIIVDAIFALNIAYGGTNLGQCGMIYVLGQTRIAVATMADAGLIPQKANGLGPTTDTCIRMSIAAETLDAVTGVEVGWMPIGNGARTGVVTTPGMVLWEEVDGRIILPPGRFMGLHVMASEVDPTFVMGMMWHEKVLTLA